MSSLSGINLRLSANILDEAKKLKLYPPCCDRVSMIATLFIATPTQFAINLFSPLCETKEILKNLIFFNMSNVGTHVSSLLIGWPIKIICQLANDLLKIVAITISLVIPHTGIYLYSLVLNEESHVADLLEYIEEEAVQTSKPRTISLDPVEAKLVLGEAKALKSFRHLNGKNEFQLLSAVKEAYENFVKSLNNPALEMGVELFQKNLVTEKDPHEFALNKYKEILITLKKISKDSHDKSTKLVNAISDLKFGCIHL